jgi:hypothetical protein
LGGAGLAGEAVDVEEDGDAGGDAEDDLADLLRIRLRLARELGAEIAARGTLPKVPASCACKSPVTSEVTCTTPSRALPPHEPAVSAVSAVVETVTLFERTAVPVPVRETA